MSWIKDIASIKLCKQKTWNLRYNSGKLNSIKEALKHRDSEITLCILT